jgi:beta-lactamase regulating signal transducer with metallopeptidase domain
MTPTALEASGSLLSQLMSPAARALALGGAAGLGLAAFRVRTTAVRLFTWTAVLYAALAMPLLGWMLPALPVPAPSFLQHGYRSRLDQPTARPVLNHIAASEPRGLNLSPSAANKAAIVPNETAAPAFSLSAIPWSVVAAAIYLAGAFFLLARFVVGVALSRRLLQSSPMIDAPSVVERLAFHASAAGLTLIPRVAESEFISVPVTVGALRSTILLPAGWRDWDDAKLEAVVVHEMSHVARRDGLTQRLSLLHRAIFWFSPFAWWLDHHLADLAEQASDEAALSCGADRKDYARTLLSFFEALHAAPGRVWWQGVAMAKAGQAEQRVERILAWKGTVAMNLKNMNLKKSIAAAVVVLAVPVVYLAASAQPANHNPEAPVLDFGQDQATPAMPPTAPTAPRHAHAAKASTGRGYSYSYGYDDSQRFVIVAGNSDSLTMSGTTGDAEFVQDLKKTIKGDFIWFERDGKSYIIQDPATIERARKLWAPQDELGKKQEALGKLQEALGEQQETLGAKMEQVQVKVPDMTADLDKLKAELKELNSSATVEQVGKIQSEIGDLQSKIGDLQSQAGEEQSKLGEKMGALGEKQGKLCEQQGELGRQQGELAQKANREMKRILDEALTKGTATPLKPSSASL